MKLSTETVGLIVQLADTSSVLQQNMITRVRSFSYHAVLNTSHASANILNEHEVSDLNALQFLDNYYHIG